MPGVVACGGRESAYRKFCSAIRNARDGDFIVLLVDSEGPVRGKSPWHHLRSRDGWTKPDEVGDDGAHLMVEVMESWFLADRETLKGYFGRGFREAALSAHAAIEDIHKADVLAGLKNATRSCVTKSQYDKGQHSFEILSRLDPDKVTQGSPHAERLLSTLRRAT